MNIDQTPIYPQVEMTTYLSRFKEEMPQWLRDYTPGDDVSVSDFMSGRIGYYPGSGEDNCLILTATKAQCTHCFIHIDYMVKKERLHELISQGKIRPGYHSIGRVEWNDRDLFPNGRYHCPYHPRPSKAWLKPDLTGKTFAFLEIFERDAEVGEEEGPERFAVAFLFDDGIEMYYQLFVMEYLKAPWIVLLQDHGFGGNYDRFGFGGLMSRIVFHYKVRPEFLLCAENTDNWRGFQPVCFVDLVRGGMHNSPRHLFQWKEREHKKC